MPKCIKKYGNIGLMDKGKVKYMVKSEINVEYFFFPSFI